MMTTTMMIGMDVDIQQNNSNQIAVNQLRLNYKKQRKNK